MTVPDAAREPVLSIRSATLSFGDRELWRNLNLDVQPGEFLAVLGPNGAGKTSLLRIMLGQLQPTSGRVALDRGRIGYVPQQRVFDRDLPLRGRDLVRFGLDGNRWGVGRLGANDRKLIDDVIASVGASELADAPLGRLSGGEQQRLRVAQALVSEPGLLLADEPLLSLDLAYQQVIVSLLDERRRSAGTPVVFVTHDVNPILTAVDRVLYLGPDGWAIGSVDDVLNTETLSRLYGIEVDVLRVRGRVVVVGTPDAEHVHHVH
jgi:zinc/manganese transport system ATP-binding protein